MTVNPHPIAWNIAATQRRAELLALVERERLARLATGQALPSRTRLVLPAVQAMVGMLALLLAATR